MLTKLHVQHAPAVALNVALDVLDVPMLLEEALVRLVVLPHQRGINLVEALRDFE